MYFAHGTTEQVTSLNPALVITIVTLIAAVLLIKSLWLLKRFTSWDFPKPKRNK